MASPAAPTTAGAPPSFLSPCAELGALPVLYSLNTRPQEPTQGTGSALTRVLAPVYRRLAALCQAVERWRPSPTTALFQTIKRWHEALYVSGALDREC